jgi:casein kinase II subunit beta
MVSNFKEALGVILNMEPSSELDEEQQQAIEYSAEIVYGLIHARFILTNRGLQKMMTKYQNGDFGRCSRVLCEGQRVLPVGLSDCLNENTAYVFCPRCKEVYMPKSSKHKQIDGAFFGTTFPHLLFTVYPDQRPTQAVVPFVPRCFGFRIHPTAYEVNRQTTTSAATASTAAPNQP